MISASHKKTPPQKPDCIDIKPRKVDFGLTDELPFDWYRDKSLSFCLNTISMLFPVGEKFFIDSVKRYKDKITDPVLQAQVAGFLAQEALHSREHEIFNRMLKKKNNKMVYIEKLTQFFLDLGRIFPARTQLAITCALEHFTALFANALFSHFDSFTKLAHPTFRDLWAWHAVEELEHKAVCYDLYQAVAGGWYGYVERCAVMLVVTFNFSLAIALSLIISVFLAKKSAKPANGKAPQVGSVRKKKELIWLVYNLLIKVIPHYFAYYRPHFHPWHYDNSHFVTEWKAFQEKKSY